MPGIGVIIVTWNSADVIEQCLVACRGSSIDQILVVDNASSDDTVERVRSRGVRCIANRENRGFAAACNQGAAELDTPFLLLLNPDAVLSADPEPLAQACREPNVGAVAGLLVDPDGSPQRGFAVRRLPTPATLAFETLGLNRLWPSNPLNRSYRCLDLDHTKTQRVEQPAGAFLLVKRAVWQSLGGLDERFTPVWFEDVDLCKRLKENGLKVFLEPAVRAVHAGGHSANRLEPSARRQYWYASLLRYASKHFGFLAFRAVSVSVVIGIPLRVLASVRFPAPDSASADHAKLIKLALRCLIFGSGVIAPKGDDEARATRAYVRTSSSTGS